MAICTSKEINPTLPMSSLSKHPCAQTEQEFLFGYYVRGLLNQFASFNGCFYGCTIGAQTYILFPHNKAFSATSQQLIPRSRSEVCGFVQSTSEKEFFEPKIDTL